MIGVISDVHGNFPALKSVITRLDAAGCDRIISLGDLAGYYCMINETLDLCRVRNVVNVLGNHDDYLVNGRQCPRSSIANACIAYQSQFISAENVAFLRKSLAAYRNMRFWGVHGGWSDPLDEYVTEFDFESFRDDPTTVFASGHSHIQTMSTAVGKTYFNPGSVGQPRDGDPRAAFAIIDDRMRVSLFRVEYDIDIIAGEMRRCGFEARSYECLYEGRAIRSRRALNT